MNASTFKSCIEQLALVMSEDIISLRERIRTGEGFKYPPCDSLAMRTVILSNLSVILHYIENLEELESDNA